MQTEGHESPADVFCAVIVFAGGGHCVMMLFQRKFGLKYSLIYCRTPIREVNHGLVGEEAVGSQAAA